MRRPPVIASLLSPGALGQLVAEAWGLDLKACQVLNNNVNDHYIVTHAGGRHVLRLYAHVRGDAREISYEIALADHAAEAGVSMSRPVVRPIGDWSIVVDAPEGPRVGVLWTEALGISITDGDASAYGALVARFHAAVDDFVDPIGRRSLDTQYLVSSRLDAVRSMLSPHPEHVAWFDDHARRVSDELDRRGATATDVGPCHGDVHAGNVHVADGALTLFDMEFCGPGPRMYDLATYRWWAVFAEKGDAGVWPEFLAGYESVRPVAEADRQLIDLYVAVRNIWLLGHWASVESVEPGYYAASPIWLEKIIQIARDFDPV